MEVVARKRGFEAIFLIKRGGYPLFHGRRSIFERPPSIPLTDD